MLFSFQSPVSPPASLSPSFQKVQAFPILFHLEKSGSFAGNFIISLPLLSVKYFFQLFPTFFAVLNLFLCSGLFPFPFRFRRLPRSFPFRLVLHPSPAATSYILSQLLPICQPFFQCVLAFWRICIFQILFLLPTWLFFAVILFFIQEFSKK